MRSVTDAPRTETVASLGFGRCTLKIAAPENVTYATEMLAGERIATSYPRLLARFLAERGIVGRNRHHERRGRTRPAPRHRQIRL